MWTRVLLQTDGSFEWMIVFPRIYLFEADCSRASRSESSLPPQCVTADAYGTCSNKLNGLERYDVPEGTR
jgi:hypothetical protein